MHEAHDDHAPRRARRAPPSGGAAARDVDRRCRTRGDRAPAPAGAQAGRAELLRDRQRLPGERLRAGRRARRARRPSQALAALLMLLVDAGPLYAAAARRDRNHQRSVDVLSTAPRPLLVPALVVTEVAYLLGDRIGAHAEVAFARSLERGELLVQPAWTATYLTHS